MWRRLLEQAREATCPIFLPVVSNLFVFFGCGSKYNFVGVGVAESAIVSLWLP